MILKAASIPAGEGDREYAEAVQEALSAKSRELGRAMSYRDFTYEEVRERFGLQISEAAWAFADIPPLPVSSLLKETLHLNLPVALPGTERGRSELIVSPVLMEVYRQLDKKISLFSGWRFFVDEEQGLAGYPDFLLSRSPRLTQIDAPVLVVVEAKKDEFHGGIPQCLAAMVAAQLFNRRAGKDVRTVYGSVSSGSVWQFMSLSGVDVTIDLTEYYINEVERLVGIMVHMLKAEAPAAAEP